MKTTKKLFLSLAALALTGLADAAWRKQGEVTDYPTNSAPAAGDAFMIYDAGTGTTQNLFWSTILGGDYVWTGDHDYTGATLSAGTATVGDTNVTGTFSIGGTPITATAAELNYTDGVTSAIQTQLDAKAAKTITTKATATSYTIGTTDANELYGGVIYVTGAATLTIPAVASGASFTVITIGAVAVSVDPNASDLIYLDGTALSDGDKVTNASTAGDIAVFTYYDGTGWYAATNGWTDGN